MPPHLSLAHIIAGPESRVLLLDGPFEALAGEAERFATDPEGLRFFFQVLLCALATGKVREANKVARQLRLAWLPVKDHRLLEALWSSSCDPLDVISAMQERLGDKPQGSVELTPPSRIGHILGVAMIGWMFAVSFAEGISDSLDDGDPPTPFLVLAASLGFLLPVATALAFRGGLALRLERAEVCTLDGRAASRWRLLLRTLPLALGASAATETLVAGNVGLAYLIALGLLLIALLGAALSPARGLGDLLARTRVRPK
jgi:hypothetical protein